MKDIRTNQVFIHVAHLVEKSTSITEDLGSNTCTVAVLCFFRSKKQLLKIAYILRRSFHKFHVYLSCIHHVKSRSISCIYSRLSLFPMSTPIGAFNIKWVFIKGIGYIKTTGIFSWYCLSCCYTLCVRRRCKTFLFISHAGNLFGRYSLFILLGTDQK